jgi:glycosyltransferase involved in cell wall biosynthesis
MATGRPIIALSANSSWNIVNFRSGLIRGLRDAGYDPIVIAPDDAASLRRMNELAVEYIPLKIDRSGMNPIADLRLQREYRSILERLKPTAFLGFTIKPNIYGSLAASALGIPAIPNVSGLGTAFIRAGPLQWLVTRLYRRAFRNLPLVFFQNPDDRHLFVERRIVQQERTALLAGSGINLERFAQSPFPAGSVTFLLIARLLRDKGVVEFVDAARQLRAEIPGARFQLLGPIDEGNRTAVPRSEVEQWVNHELVEYLGAVDDVRPYIRAASAIVLPSYREGLPRTLLEAGAMARPLIATDVPGCREVVEEGVNGFLCPARNPSALAAAMKKFADLPEKSKTAMGAASRRKVQERFSEAVVVGAYLDALDRLVRRSV